jgi:hypothetical protein
MKDAYSILSGRDFTTKKVSAKLREEQFEAFKKAQKQALDYTNWHEFLKIILGLGYKSSELISSGVSTLLCKRPGFVFGDGCAREGGNFPFPRSAIVEKVCAS